jgi:5-methylcytosine-specific restriction endonuclease McrBC regulatory subunit McrC
MDILRRKGWDGLAEEVRDAHRADLHQALAYASLADAPRVDTVLVYPQVVDERQPVATVASVTSGRRRVRLILASIPFGFRNLEQQAATLGMFREVLAV